MKEKILTYKDNFVENEVYHNKLRIKDLNEQNKKTIYVLGGRATSKSYSIASNAIYEMITQNISILVMRKNEKGHRASTFVLFKQIISNLGLTKHFTFNLSPLSITCKLNGANIQFKGLSDPDSIKGILGTTPIGITWFEEASQFDKEQPCLDVVQSIRDFETPKVYYSLNPSTGKNHWIARKFMNNEFNKNETGITTTIYDNKFNTKDFIESIEALKETAPKQYLQSALGQFIIDGDVVFNLTNGNIIEEIESQTPNKINIGIDYGQSAGCSFVATAFFNNYKDIQVFKEYHHSNKESGENRTVNEYLEDLIKFNEEVKKQFPRVQIRLYFDSAGGSEVLYNLAKRNGMYNAKYANKNKIGDRITIIDYLINTKSIKILKQNEELITAFEEATRDPEANNNSQYINDNDTFNNHIIDAFAYSITSDLKRLKLKNLVLEDKEKVVE